MNLRQLESIEGHLKKPITQQVFCNIPNTIINTFLSKVENVTQLFKE